MGGTPPQPQQHYLNENMHFHLRGYYGHQNTGDDALAAATVFGLEQIAPNSVYRIAAPRQLVVPVASKMASFLSERQRFRGQFKLMAMSQALRCGWTVFGGGSLIRDVTSCRFLKRMTQLVSFLTSTGHRVAMLGMGVGPVQTKEGCILARSLISKATVFTVRDIRSADLCQEMGLPRPPVVGDIAMLLTHPEYPPIFRSTRVKSSNKPILGIAVCHYHRHLGCGDDLDNRCLDKIALALRELITNRPCQLVFFEFNGHPQRGDRLAIERIRASLGDCTTVQVLPYDPNPKNVLEDFRACDAILAMRLHSAVFAFLAQKPLVMLSYHPKCMGFAEEVGLPSDFVLDGEGFCEQVMCEQLGKIITHPIKANCKVETNQMIERAMENFNFLSKKF